MSDARAAGMAFFPPLGKLAYVIGPAATDGGLVQLIDPASRTVETVARNLEMGEYSNTMEYSPRHRKLYFGGGGGSGSWKTLPSPPQKLNGSSSVAVMATDIPEHGVVFFMSPSLKKVFLYKHAAAGAPVGAGSRESKGMRVYPGPGGGLVILLPEGLKATGSPEIRDLAGRRAAVLPAAARVHWRPQGDFSGPVAVRRLAAGGVVEPRWVLPPRP